MLFLPYNPPKIINILIFYHVNYEQSKKITYIKNLFIESSMTTSENTILVLVVA